ncbi:MAG: lysophospholipid acyltransferase family protein [Syntrophobacterales bacterium]|nr:lysophospholipid acyltransferase family protein [Syntrophobacterales bacterium]
MRNLRPSKKLHPIIKPLAIMLEKISALDKLQLAYSKIPSFEDPYLFIEEVIRSFGIQVIMEGNTNSIPPEGPLLVVANHPFGGLEGLILAKFLLDHRRDVKILGNYLLSNIEELKSLIIGVDPFERSDSPLKNAAPLRFAIEWLEGGGVLGVFAAGSVSHLSLKKLRVEDSPWNPVIAKVAMRTKVPILPIFFHGSNRPLFHIAGVVHPRLRTLLLPREFEKKRGHNVRMTVGALISQKEYESIGVPESVIEYFRVKTYSLGLKRPEGKKTVTSIVTLIKKKGQKLLEPLAEPIDTKTICREVEALPEESVLVKSGHYYVFSVSSDLIPSSLLEIGRLREFSFRTVGEGTGKARDIDLFDRHYDHLFLWNQDRKEIVGAYRIGRADRILDLYGIKGLYTSTLFKYHPSMYATLKKSLELGRSFIRPEYQKNHTPLWLLWKGIGAYIAKGASASMLFGPVSISSHYHPFSRALIISFLKRHFFSQSLADSIVPRHPWKKRLLPPWDNDRLWEGFSKIEDLNRIVSSIEGNGRGIPVLLKHYLKLGGKAAGFNVDPKFSNVLDVLLFVDLNEVSRAMLDKTIGKERADLSIINRN